MTELLHIGFETTAHVVKTFRALAILVPDLSPKNDDWEVWLRLLFWSIRENVTPCIAKCLQEWSNTCLAPMKLDIRDNTVCFCIERPRGGTLVEFYWDATGLRVPEPDVDSAQALHKGLWHLGQALVAAGVARACEPPTE